MVTVSASAFRWSPGPRLPFPAYSVGANLISASKVLILPGFHRERIRSTAIFDLERGVWDVDGVEDLPYKTYGALTATVTGEQTCDMVRVWKGRTTQRMLSCDEECVFRINVVVGNLPSI